MKWRRIDLAALVDRDRDLDDAAFDGLIEQAGKNIEAARTIKDQLLMDNLLSLYFSPARRHFTNRVLAALDGPEGAARFIATTLSAGQRLAAPAPRRGSLRRLVGSPMAAAAMVLVLIGVAVYG